MNGFGAQSSREGRWEVIFTALVSNFDAADQIWKASEQNFNAIEQKRAVTCRILLEMNEQMIGER